MRQGVLADRRLLRAAVLGVRNEPEGETGSGYRVLRGTVADAGPYVLTLASSAGRESLALEPGTRVWRGEEADPADLRPGDDAVVRIPRGAPSPDRVWAAFGRVTGLISAVHAGRAGDRLEVDTGPSGLRSLLIPRRYADRIAVRHPRLRPGNPIDVIGVYAQAGAAVLYGVLPATAQPPSTGVPVDAPTAVSTGAPPAGLVFHGSVTWRETAPGDAMSGLAYPAIDPATAAGAACDRPGAGRPYLPYLSVGSEPRVRNECTGLAARLPVVACAATAPLFHDRCLTCGTSPRGRLAELTPVAFAALGGELDAGCFNATVTVG